VKRRSIEEQHALVEEWQSSGESIKDFCTRKHLSFDSFKRWKRKALIRAEAEARFLPVAVIPRQAGVFGLPCRIMVGERIAIECDERSSPKAVETAIRAAVAVCGLTSRS
jgi:hypothetical protein